MGDPTPSPVPSYVASILRTLGGLVAGWLIAKGYITAEQAPQLGGAALTVFIVVWGLVQKANAHKALSAAIRAPSGQAS